MHEWDAAQARPWSSPTVIWDEEERIFKAWYSGSDIAPERWTAVGYATSTDGVTWEKPRLGLHEFRGSSANNIVVMGYGPVLKDTAEPDPAKRYKMILRGPRPRTGRRGCGAGGEPWGAAELFAGRYPLDGGADPALAGVAGSLARLWRPRRVGPR